MCSLVINVSSPPSIYTVPRTSDSMLDLYEHRTKRIKELQILEILMASPFLYVNAQSHVLDDRYSEDYISIF